LIGFAVITEYPTAVNALVIGVYILFVIREHRKLFNFKPYFFLFLGASIPLCALLLYNRSVFGNPFSLSYIHEADQSFRAGQSSGFMGFGLPDPGILFYMTFHTTMGIFWQSPVLLFSFIGWFRMWRNDKYRSEAVLSFSVISIYFVLLSGYYTWWGGLAFTPRHIIPVLPFFGIPLAFIPEKLRKAFLVAALFSIGQMLVVVSSSYYGLGNITINYSRGLFYKMFENSTIYNVYLPNFLTGKLVPNLGQEFFKLNNLYSLLPLFMVELALVGYFLFLSSSRKIRLLE
jgi:hypothetical protein